MKPAWLTPAMLQDFQQIQGFAVIVLVLAIIPWFAQDFVSSLAATQMTAHTTLRTTTEKDDARVTRAFASARRGSRGQVTFVTEENPRQETRDALLTITAGSKREALDELAETVAAMKTAFARDGTGELYDIGNTPSARPVPSARTAFARNMCRGLAVLILALGLVVITNRLRYSGLSRASIFAIAAGLTGWALLSFGGVFVWIFALPVFLLGLVTVVTARVHRATKWNEGQAQVTKSRVVVKRHQFSGEATQVTNHASVAYDFTVGSQLFHGNRISLGFAPADDVNVTLKRFPAGATVPVFYDPANPADCALERKPPVSLGCLWGGALSVTLIYAAVIFSIGKNESIANSLQDTFQQAFPRIHHPILMITAGLFGLLCLASWLWNRRHVRKAFPWLATKGRIVSSRTESYVELGGGSSRHRYYHALIEYSYTVDGQEFHNTINEPGTMQSSAEVEAARYVAGTEVDVHYDPQNPTHSALAVDTAMVLDGHASLVVGLVSLAIAIYLARH
jgi:hypothetical protein